MKPIVSAATLLSLITGLTCAEAHCRELDAQRFQDDIKTEKYVHSA